MIISLSAIWWIRAQIWWGKKVGGGSGGRILVRSNLFFRGESGTGVERRHFYAACFCAFSTAFSFLRFLLPPFGCRKDKGECLASFS